MTEKSQDTVRLSRDEAERIAREWATPENLARLDAMSDADVAEAIASDEDAAPELTETWFEGARLVIPLRGQKAA